MEKRLIRDNPDIPKEDRDPDVILGRMEHFWRGHDVKGVTMPDDRFSSKEFSISRNERYGGVAGGLDIGFEGGLTPIQTRKLNIHTAYDDLREKDLEDGGLRNWLINQRKSQNPEETPMYYLADTLRPVDIVRHNRNSNRPDVDTSQIWEEHASRVKDKFTNFKELADEFDENDPQLHKKVINFTNNLPSKAPGYKETLTVGNVSPHYLGGQFARVEYVPRTPGRDSYTWGRLVSGGDMHNDLIDLRTGSWARIAKDQRGTEHWDHPRFDV